MFLAGDKTNLRSRVIADFKHVKGGMGRGQGAQMPLPLPNKRLQLRLTPRFLNRKVSTKKSISYKCTQENSREL